MSRQLASRASTALALLLVTGALAATSAGAASANLFTLLRTSEYPDITLPAAFSSATLSTGVVSGKARSLGATGAVQVDVDGPDPTAGILIVIFRTDAAAKAGVGSVTPTVPDMHLVPSGKVNGVAASAMSIGWVPGVDALNNETKRAVVYAAAQQDNVVVAGFTVSMYATRVDKSGAIGLMKSGLAHVRTVSKHL